MYDFDENFSSNILCDKEIFLTPFVLRLKHGRQSHHLGLISCIVKAPKISQKDSKKVKDNK